MLAVLGIGDCELLLLRSNSEQGCLEVVFSLDDVRRSGGIGDRVRTRLTREDPSEREVDESFTSISPFDVIESESIVRCVSVREGDIVVLSSGAVFESLQREGVEEICNEVLCGKYQDNATSPQQSLDDLAEGLVFVAQSRTIPEWLSRKAASDTSVVVARVTDWQLSYLATQNTPSAASPCGDFRGKMKLPYALAGSVSSVPPSYLQGHIF